MSLLNLIVIEKLFAVHFVSPPKIITKIGVVT
jgi:hypothetical protein